jgi:hypothetical protein
VENGPGRELLKRCITASGADVVLVIGDEYLYNDLSRALTQTNGATSTTSAMRVVHVPKLGGVKTRIDTVRRAARVLRCVWRVACARAHVVQCTRVFLRIARAELAVSVDAAIG